jgi:signal recognition particle receptor subunit beta
VSAVDKGGVISSELLAESLSRRPIILIGDVGVGKTTFIHNLIYIEAATLFENVITIYIDLGVSATLSTDLRTFLVDEISRQLLEDHQVDIFERNFVRGIYYAELDRFGKGIYADFRDTNNNLYKSKEIEFLEGKIKNTEQHLKHSLNHIAKGRKKQIVLFIDNSDQRDEATQQQVFLISQEIASGWHPVTVFVALRPETFYRSLRIGALSGYHPKAFTISPPNIGQVIEKRLKFALKLTTGEFPIESLSGVQVRLQNLGQLIKVFLSTLARNSTIGECIDNMAGGNVRIALNLVRGFFGSGHVDTQKIVRIYETRGDYTIPQHEFLRAVIYGDAEHYDPEQSPITNLFDIFREDAKEHFLLPLTIGLLASSSGSDVEEGFVETSAIYERLQGFGYTPEQIDSVIIRGYDKRLLETAARRIPRPGMEMPQALRVTTIGLYHVARLCRLFSYIDAIIVDIPILDSNKRQSVHNERTIARRLDRADMFRCYLDEKWKFLEDKAAAFVFDWREISSDLKDNIEYVRSRINRDDTY